MKKAFQSVLFSFVLYLVFPGSGLSIISAQIFPVDTILYNGNTSRFINLVYLGDGFQSSQFASYTSSVQASTNYLFSISPFLEYKNYFNVFSIRVPSVESGADHPGTATDVSEPAHPLLVADTYFNSTFDRSSIHRLLVAANTSAINSVVASNFPQFDQKLILVNSPYYGGSGGANAAASLNGSSNEIMVHEIGHSFAGLQDEYWSGLSWETANMSQQSNPVLVRWASWIGFNGVGVYQHCCGGSSATWYRPSNNCKMRTLNAPFCPVCKEGIIEKIHQVFGTPILSYLPLSDTLPYCSQAIDFRITTVKPIPNTLRVKWLLNGNLIQMNIDSLTLQSLQLNPGSNLLRAEVRDTTAMIRVGTHATSHDYFKEWVISYYPAPGVSISPPGVSEICMGDSIYLTADSAAYYSWSNGATTQTIAVSAAGSYAVYINNCPDNTDSVSIWVNAIPIPVVVPVGALEFCTGDSISLSTAVQNTYLWSTGDTTQNVFVSNGGNYSVTVTDSNGCQGTSGPIQVNEHFLPVVSLGNDTAICGTCSLTLDAGNPGSVVSWSTGASAQNIVVTGPGLYWVTVTDSNGCVSSDSIFVNLFVARMVDRFLNQSELLVFPNPTEGVFTVELTMNKQETVSIFVYSLLGNRVAYSAISNPTGYKFSETINLFPVGKGVYFIRVITESHVFVRQIIVQ